MGIEYIIKFNCPNVQELDRLLRQAPYFSAYLDAHNSYEYRSNSNQSPAVMPDATASIEPEGIYFCDHCSQKAKDVFDYLHQQASQLTDEVVIEEL